MADKIKLSVISSEGAAYEKAVNYVNLPTAFGSLGILSGHAPMLCAVSEGIVRCTWGEDGKTLVKIGSGIANVAHNEVTLLVSTAEVIE